MIETQLDELVKEEKPNLFDVRLYPCHIYLEGYMAVNQAHFAVKENHFIECVITIYDL